MMVENETTEVNRSIPCEIYAVRAGRLAGSPTPRVYMTLTFDAVSYARLGGLLMANLKGTTTIHVVDIQAPLDEDGDDAQPPIPKLTPQMALPEDDGTEVRTMIVDGAEVQVRTGKRNGSRADNGWTLHAFAVNEETPGLCGICHHREDDDVHDAGKGPHPYEDDTSGENVCTVCGEGEEDDRHDPAKRVHIYEVEYDKQMACTLCGRPDADPIHEGALSATAASLIDAIAEDEDFDATTLREHPGFGKEMVAVEGDALVSDGPENPHAIEVEA